MSENAFTNAAKGGRMEFEMLRLRPYKPCDAKYVVSWITDEDMFLKWSAGRFGEYPLTEDGLNAHYSEAADNDKFWQMTAIDESGKPVGHFIMRFTDDAMESIRLGFVIVDGSIRGKGYGKEMITLALKYAQDFLRVKEATLGVFENNPAALYCYKAAGFKEYEGGRTEEYNIYGRQWKCIELYAPLGGADNAH